MFGVLLSLSSVFAGKEGGGGDSYSLEFTSLAHAISEQLTSRQVVINNVDPALFSSRVADLKVVTQDRTLLNNAEVDAINYPSESKIDLNRTRWALYGDDIQRKMNLVFHEVVSLMGLKDDRYQISRIYLAKVDSFPILQRTKADAYSFCIGKVAETHKNWSVESIKAACNNSNPNCVGRLVPFRSTWAPQSLVETCNNNAHPHCVQIVAKTNPNWAPQYVNAACIGNTAECVAYVAPSRPGWLPEYLISMCSK